MIYYFHPDAEAEHIENVAYYESKQAGLGDAYLDEFASVLELIVEILEGFDARLARRNRGVLQGPGDTGRRWA